MTGHRTGTQGPLPESKRQVWPRGRTAPPSSPTHTLPSLPEQGLPSTVHLLRSRHSTLSSLLRALRSACLETLEPAGLATPSLELIRLPLLAPPLGAGCVESFLPQQPLPGTWHKPVWAPRPQPLATPPGGSSKMHKCLRTHPQQPKALFSSFQEGLLLI